MYYTVYKTTNIINGKVYIGCHKTSNLNDDYLGSGKLLKKAIKKYGRENFEKEILEVFETPEDMFEMESILVNKSFIDNKDTYNLKEGGDRGFCFINRESLNNKNHNNSPQGHIVGALHAKRMKEDQDYREKRLEQLEKTRVPIDPQAFKGKKHTSETKKKIGTKNSKNQKGKGNSNYGKCWIYNEKLKVSKSIKKEEIQKWIDEGWKKGRKLNFN